jgi:hypothetical protein
MSVPCFSPLILLVANHLQQTSRVRLHNLTLAPGCRLSDHPRLKFDMSHSSRQTHGQAKRNHGSSWMFDPVSGAMLQFDAVKNEARSQLSGFSVPLNGKQNCT